MKKSLGILLILVMLILSLAGCAGDKGVSSTDTQKEKAVIRNQVVKKQRKTVKTQTAVKYYIQMVVPLNFSVVRG